MTMVGSGSNKQEEDRPSPFVLVEEGIGQHGNDEQCKGAAGHKSRLSGQILGRSSRTCICRVCDAFVISDQQPGNALTRCKIQGSATAGQ